MGNCTGFFFQKELLQTNVLLFFVVSHSPFYRSLPILLKNKLLQQKSKIFNGILFRWVCAETEPRPIVAPVAQPAVGVEFLKLHPSVTAFQWLFWTRSEFLVYGNINTVVIVKYKTMCLRIDQNNE